MASHISPDSSMESSSQNSRQLSIDHEPSKPRHNVKFTVGDEEEVQPPSSKRQTLPEIRLQEADITESTAPSSLHNIGWIRRKDEAALSAHNKATRHADKVKKHNSGPNSRRTSFDQPSTAVASPIVASPYASPPQRPATDIRLDDIPLEKLNKPKRVFDMPEETTDDDEEDDDDLEGHARPTMRPQGRPEATESRQTPCPQKSEVYFSEARRLFRTFTRNDNLTVQGPSKRSGTATPLVDQHSHEYDYVPRPTKYQRSVLSHLLAAQNQAATDAPHFINRESQEEQMSYISDRLERFQGKDDPRRKDPDFIQNRKGMPSSPGSLSGTQTPLWESGGSSGTMTPRPKRPKWYKNQAGQWNSKPSLVYLMDASVQAAVAPATPEANTQTSSRRSPLKRNVSSGRLSVLDVVKHPIDRIRQAGSSINLNRNNNSVRMAGLANRLASQEYIIEICKALMAYGAPTHRLEEFLSMAARKLCIQASFQYLPGCMILSFDDPDTHTTELKLVKEPTAVDLGKLLEVQHVYKDIMHELYSIEEAMDDIREIRIRPKRFGTLWLVFTYGIAAVAVGPFAFSARPQDFPISFFLGCILGALQLGLASRSSQFSHIFEVFGTFITSFLARGFGSILTSSGEPIFCFAALAQSSIALILPGWIILSAALELQSRNIIAGSIRMVYAIIYTLFLGFGILIGTTIMGLIYPNATNDISCHMPSYWETKNDWTLIYTKFIWVPVFTVCLAVINQAKWEQMPWMVFISFVGYQVNYWSTQKFSQNIQVANALGALAIGFLANGYSRFRHGVAAAAMLPAIFVMVPSGLAASGSLVAGLTSANQITRNVTGISIINNGTQGFYDAQNTTTTTTSQVYSGTIFNVGYGMVQVAIGISVGLFLSALMIYPFGKKRSGIFSF